MSEEQILSDTLKSGENAVDAVPQTPTERTKTDEFLALINGEFKEEYGKKVGETIKLRLKKGKQIENLKPILDDLYFKFGIEGEDEELLLKMYNDERTKNQFLIGKRLDGSSAEYEEVKRDFPSFDFDFEAKNPKFIELIKNENVTPNMAYKLLHHDEILKEATQNATDEFQKKIELRLRRPRENGANMCLGVLQTRGVSALSLLDRDEIDKRVAKGETITL